MLPREPLLRAQKILESILEQKAGQAVIVPDHGFDESILIGTSDSLLKVAIAIIDTIVESSFECPEFSCANNESKVRLNKIGEVFSPDSLCRPVRIEIAPTEADAMRKIDLLIGGESGLTFFP